MAIKMPSVPNFVTSSFYLQFNTQQFESPLSKAIQRVSLSGPRWIASFSLPAMTRDFALEWVTFFNNLKGNANTFESFDPEGKFPRGSAGGVPLVNGASQTGNTLITDGWPISTTGILLKGDYFSVNNELKQIIENADSDGAGNSTLTFEPALRNSPANNAPIITTLPIVEMILTSDDAGIFTTNPNGIYLPKSFSAIEPLSI